MRNFVIKDSRGQYVRNFTETGRNSARTSYTEFKERAQVFERYGCACAACRKLGYNHDLKIYHREGEGDSIVDTLIENGKE